MRATDRKVRKHILISNAAWKWIEKVCKDQERPIGYVIERLVQEAIKNGR